MACKSSFNLIGLRKNYQHNVEQLLINYNHLANCYPFGSSADPIKNKPRGLGLAQAWNKIEINNHLCEFNFNLFSLDPCVFWLKMWWVPFVHEVSKCWRLWNL